MISKSSKQASKEFLRPVSPSDHPVQSLEYCGWRQERGTDAVGNFNDRSTVAKDVPLSKWGSKLSCCDNK